MPDAPECFGCSREREFDRPPVWERIAHDEYWRIAHAIRSALPGWLDLLPRRHVTVIADRTDTEGVRLGTWQPMTASRALPAATGCTKTYVVQIAGTEGFSHVHFHLVPRLPDQPADRLGPRSVRLPGPHGDQRHRRRHGPGFRRSGGGLGHELVL